jgi:hypothetical protein
VNNPVYTNLNLVRTLPADEEVLLDLIRIMNVTKMTHMVK